MAEWDNMDPPTRAFHLMLTEEDCEWLADLIKKREITPRGDS
jgi:hypothetical protein